MCHVLQTSALVKVKVVAFFVRYNYLFELFLKRRGTMKLILNVSFYHLCLRMFSNCINISSLNSDSLFVNNHEDQQLSTINICLLHCARISCNLLRNNSS